MNETHFCCTVHVKYDLYAEGRGFSKNNGRSYTHGRQAHYQGLFWLRLLGLLLNAMR